VPAVLKRSDHVFTVSESERRAILEHYGNRVRKDRLTAVQNGGGESAIGSDITDHAESLSVGYRGVPDRSLRERTALYVGSLSRRKNAQGLVAGAIALAREEGVDTIFVGATGSSLRQTGIDVPADVAGRLHFLGQVNDPGQIEELYRRSMVFLFPSYYEASPLPPVEAMSYGCPVVCADIPSLRERCGDAAVFVDPADHEGLVKQVRHVLNDPLHWSELQQRGLAQASSFSWTQQVRSVLREILDHSTLGRRTRRVP
jgi:glycosyltransferase involved in cell wall biosynthesis